MMMMMMMMIHVKNYVFSSVSLIWQQWLTGNSGSLATVAHTGKLLNKTKINRSSIKVNAQQLNHCKQTPHQWHTWSVLTTTTESLPANTTSVTYLERLDADVLQRFVGISSDVGCILEHVQTCCQLSCLFWSLLTPVRWNATRVGFYYELHKSKADFEKLWNHSQTWSWSFTGNNYSKHKFDVCC